MCVILLIGLTHSIDPYLLCLAKCVVHICDLQKVDIYQNTRDPPVPGIQTHMINIFDHLLQCGCKWAVGLIGFLMVPMDPQGHREH